MKKTVSLSIALIIACSAHAQISITKDVSFGINGTVTIQTGLPEEYSHLLLIPNIHSTLQGNKIFVGYPYSDPGNPSLKSQFTRLNSDGTLDATFGTNGNVRLTDFEPYYFYADNNAFYLNGNKKYFSDGQMDADFASSGVMQNTDWAYKTVLPDGKIFLRWDTSFHKFLSNGNPDPSYGTNGIIGISGAVAGDPNSSYDYFFSKDHFIYEVVSPSPGQSGIRKIDVNSGTIDVSYGQNGYAQVQNTNLPAGAGYAKSVVTPQSDGSFINKLLGANNIYFTKTNASGALDTGFGVNGFITGNGSSAYNGNTYSASITDPLVYNNLILMPAEYTDAQSRTRWGISAYSMNGNSMAVNGSSFLPLSDIYYESLGFLFSKDNYLYAIHDNNITRYVIQQSASTLALAESKAEEADIVQFNNPFNEELKLYSKGKIKSVEIKDMAGRTIMKSENENVDTSSLTKGSYIILIVNEKGETISRKGVKL